MKKVRRIIMLFVVIVFTFTSAFAVTPQNSSGVRHSTKESNQVSRFIVKYKDSNQSVQLSKKIKNKLEKNKKIKNNLEILETKSEMTVAELMKEIENMGLKDAIEYVQEDTIIKAFEENPVQDEKLTVTGEVYGGNEILIYPGLEQVWGLTTGEGVVVGVIDTGIDISHEDLKNNIWLNNDEIPGDGIDQDGNGYVDDVNGWNFAGDNNDIYDENASTDEEHGTAIAGIIAAEKDNGAGIAGTAPKAKVMPLKVFKDGQAYTSDIIEAIEYAGAKGVKTINCSWGTGEDNQALKDAMVYSGMLFICAAGNSGADLQQSPVYPACFGLDNIISVASINSSRGFSGFSNYSNSLVDIAAPGEEITSTIPCNQYSKKNGTSIAAAFVSGEAALVLSKYKEAAVQEVKNRIIGNSDKITALEGKVRGGSRINCLAAVTGSGITPVSGSNSGIVAGTVYGDEYSFSLMSMEDGYSAPQDTSESVFSLPSNTKNGQMRMSVLGNTTTNLIPNYEINAYPTSGNLWRTYNTSQYNSNQYFSIGTIGSILDNVVTLSTIDRKIYTYDVLTPQTTGGGVTAGVNYFIKKHSENSFSLYVYDSSQDGSKGYAVHNSIKNDQRIPIYADGFPTMWVGNPHMPNMGLVKEIIPNGHNDHDCIRLHTEHRNLDAPFNEGMAYGVYPQVIVGKTYTVSFWYRAVTSASIGSSIKLTLWTSNSWSGSYNEKIEDTQWHRYVYTGIAPDSGSANIYIWPQLGATIDISEIQFEEGQSPSSFVLDTKSTHTVRVKSVGKNLFNINGDINNRGTYITELSNNLNYPNRVIDDTTIEVGNWSSAYHGLGQILKVRPNTTYYFGGYAPNSNTYPILFIVHTQNGSNKVIKYIQRGINDKSTYTTASDETELILTFGVSVSGYISNQKIQNVFFSEYDMSASYEPYYESTAYLPNDIKLNSLSNGVKDEISISTGQYIKRIAEYTINEDDITAIYTFKSNADLVRVYKPNLTGGIGIGCYTKNWVNIFGMSEYITSTAWDDIAYIGMYSTGISSAYLDFIVRKGAYATLESAKKAFSGKKLIYQLAQPEVQQINTQPLTCYENGTIYIENEVRDTAKYDIAISIDNIMLPIKRIESIHKIDGALRTPVSLSNAAIASDGLSFTITGAQNGDMYEYVYRYADELSTLPTIRYSVPTDSTSQSNGNTEAINMLQTKVDNLEQRIKALEDLIKNGIGSKNIEFQYDANGNLQAIIAK